MCVVALYDIHGNLPALEAVLSEVKRLEVDYIVVGGDVIVGPMSSQCLDRLVSLPIPTHFIKGNCETAVLHYGRLESAATNKSSFESELRWTRDQLSADHLEIISNWPLSLTLPIEGLGDVLFCHASPNSEFDTFTRQTPMSILQPVFTPVKADLVVCGHTHMQFDLMIGLKRVVNAGSIGMPFGIPGSHWLRLGPAVEFCCTHYDVEQAVKTITSSEYPGAIDFVSKYVLKTPSREAMETLLNQME